MRRLGAGADRTQMPRGRSRDGGPGSRALVAALCWVVIGECCGCAHKEGKAMEVESPVGKSGEAATTAEGGAQAAIGPSTTVSAIIRAPIGEVFAYAVAEDVLPKVLKRYGPIPPIVRTELLRGPWERVGADRTVFLKGGGTLHEQITRFERPASFGYQIDRFERTPLRALARRAIGSWTFTEIAGATHIEWTYSFEPKSGASRPIVWLFVRTFYRGFMRQALRLMKADIERASRGDA